jgi:hypothetical protein
MMQNLQPLLDLIMQGGGRGLNLSGIQNWINQWAA